MKRVETARKLFGEGYNCAQAVFAAYSDLYGIEKETALKLSASFGGGVGRMREVCGAVSGMCMIAGLETGTAKQMDDEGKKYNYEVVQKLAQEFKNLSCSIICRELLGLESNTPTDPTPQKRNTAYYNTRPCEQLVMDAAGIIEKVLYQVKPEPVTTLEQIIKIAELANVIWKEHYEPILGRKQVEYMLEHFQSVAPITEQINTDGYQYYILTCYGGDAGYLSIHKEEEALFLSKFYIAKKFRGRGYAHRVISFLEDYCYGNRLNKIRLTVNKYNDSSIAIYESLGFIKSGTQVTDIGEGYVMDDYVMEKRLRPLSSM